MQTDIMSPTYSNASVRPPVVAGFFYPRDAERLRDMVQALVAQAPEIRVQRRAMSYIVPHAGYVYSGCVAAAAYAHMLRTGIAPRRIVLIGPSHRVPLRGIAVPQASVFRTPLGDITLDGAAVRTLLQRGDVTCSDVPHAQEHSLEVQLPFLQELFEDFELVPLVVGDATPSYVASVLATVVCDDRTLLLASSDLSHYLTYEQAREADAETHTRILALADNLRGEQACGAAALNGVLRLARSRQGTVSGLALMSSGDTAGDHSRVVGYGAYAIHDDRALRSH